jgi:hypothetical protein
VDESKKIVIRESTPKESHFPAVAFEQICHHLGAELLQFVRRAADSDLFVLGGPARQLILKLIHNRAVDTRGQMLLDGGDFVFSQQSLDFDHHRPHYAHIDGIRRYAALEGLLNDGSAGFSIPS